MLKLETVSSGFNADAATRCCARPECLTCCATTGKQTARNPSARKSAPLNMLNSKPNRSKRQRKLEVTADGSFVVILSKSTLQRLFEVLDRLLDPLVEFNSRLPTKDFFRAGNVRLADLWVVHRQRFVFDCRFRPRDSDDFLCKLFNGHL